MEIIELFKFNQIEYLAQFVSFPYPDNQTKQLFWSKFSHENCRNNIHTLHSMYKQTNK
jgi:hypothetical protein